MEKDSLPNIHESFGEECLHSFFLYLWDTMQPPKIYLGHWFSNSGTHHELSGSWIYTFIIQTSAPHILGHPDSAGLTPRSLNSLLLSWFTLVPSTYQLLRYEISKLSSEYIVSVSLLPSVSFTRIVSGTEWCSKGRKEGRQHGLLCDLLKTLLDWC